MKITVTQRLKELGYTLPPVPKPLAAYVPAMRVGNQVWTAGQLPLAEKGLIMQGHIGQDLTTDDGIKAARQCVLNCLAAAGSVAGGVDNITKILKITVFVACGPEYYDQPKVGNGASELLAMVFAGAGAHVRSAVGVPSLPMNAPVGVEMLCEVREDVPEPDEDDHIPVEKNAKK